MIIGLDPGKSGGIAFLSKDGDLIAGHRMPVVKIGNRDIIDTDVLCELTGAAMDSDLGNWPTAIVLEFVTSFGQGRTSAFNFGRFVGALEAWATAWVGHEHLVMVTPQQWKKGFNLGKDKREALNLARVKFGHGAGIKWEVMANDGIAEAALIALYSLRKRCLVAA